MVDATRVFQPGIQVTNASGTPQSGAVLRFYSAGTSNTRTVYSDLGLSTSLGVTVTTNSSGRPAASGGAGAEVLIYTGTSAYKVTAETSAGVSLWSFDNVIGALDTSSFLTGTVIAEYPVIAKTANYTIVDGDEGKIINGNPTGGSFTLTLPSAVTMGDGWNITARHVGTANSVTVASVSAQTIDGATSRVLSFQYESMTLVSDGANWHLKDATRLILPRGYIDGCILANGSDATNDITVAAGSCRDSTNAVNITVAAFATGKQLDANWAPGDAAGMRNSAAGIANTTYHIYAVARADGTQDIYAHTSATVATVITALQAETGGAAYVYARRIGSIVRSGAAIILFTQRSDHFEYSTPLRDISVTTPGITAITSTLATVPTGVVVQADLAIYQDGNGDLIYASSLTATDTAPHPTAAPLASAGSNASRAVGNKLVWTNTSAQVRIRTNDGTTTLQAVVCGYYDSRGKDS